MHQLSFGTLSQMSRVDSRLAYTIVLSEGFPELEGEVPGGPGQGKETPTLSASSPCRVVEYHHKQSCCGEMS